MAHINQIFKQRTIAILMAIVSCLCMVFLLTTKVTAQSVEGIQSERGLSNKKEELQEQIKGLQDKTAKQQELRGVIETQLEETQVEIDTLNNEIKQLTDDIKKLEAQKEEDIKKYKNRLREMYMAEEDTTLSALLNSESFSDFLVTQDAVDRIYKKDEEMLGKLVGVIEKLQGKRKKVEQNKATLDNKQLALKQQNEELKQIIKELYDQTDKSKEELADLEQRWNNTSNSIGQNLGGGSTGNPNANIEVPAEISKGGWQLPVRHPSPYVSSSFGMRWMGFWHNHTGIDLTGGSFNNTPILATKEGVVEGVYWDGSGYGNYIIVNHGSGVHSLYAHANSFTKQTGEKVKQGELLGYAGSTGWSTGPHLHFEIRVNGSVVNPAKYIPNLPVYE